MRKRRGLPATVWSVASRTVRGPTNCGSASGSSPPSASSRRVACSGRSTKSSYRRAPPSARTRASSALYACQRIGDPRRADPGHHRGPSVGSGSLDASWTTTTRPRGDRARAGRSGRSPRAPAAGAPPSTRASTSRRRAPRPRPPRPPDRACRSRRRTGRAGGGSRGRRPARAWRARTGCGRRVAAAARIAAGSIRSQPPNARTPTSFQNGHPSNGSPQPQRSFASNPRSHRNTSSPTEQTPGVWPSSRSTSVLPLRPSPPMNSTGTPVVAISAGTRTGAREEP